jgi:hypothetical protein
MSLSTIRSGAAAGALAIALAACGGHGMVPSQSAPGFNAAIPMSTNPCYTKAVQPAWIFKGSCDITTLPAKGKTIKLAPYKGVTVTVKLGKNTSKKGAFVLVDALGGKAHDITKFKKKPFPTITPTVLKSVIYVEAVNGTNGLKFSGNLVFTIKAKKFPGKTCPLSVLEGTFPKLKWFNSPFTGKISGGTMTFTVPGSALGTLFPNGLPAGPLYFNVACK